MPQRGSVVGVRTEPQRISVFLGRLTRLRRRAGNHIWFLRRYRSCGGAASLFGLRKPGDRQAV